MRAAIADHLAIASCESSAVVDVTAARCHDSLAAAIDALRRAHTLAAGDGQQELVAVELRVALDEIAKMAGAVYTDDILDRIFSRFCIGK